MNDGRIIRLYFKTQNEALKAFDDIKSVKLCTNDTHLNSIRQIKEMYDKQDQKGEKELYVSKDKKIAVVLFKDFENNTYYDYLKYIVFTQKLIPHTLWTVSNPKTFVANMLNKGWISWNVHSVRQYGQPRLKKPSKLAGMRMSFPVTFRKAKCQCFIEGNDVWVKHRDYFSKSWSPPNGDLGKSQDYYLNKYFDKQRNKKFIYSDSWGSVVLRNEAWITIKNIIPAKEYMNKYAMMNELIQAYKSYYSLSRVDVYWGQMLQAIVDEIFDNNKFYVAE